MDYNPYGRQLTQVGMGGSKTGTVKWFNEGKGFGFIIPSDGGKDVYVNKANVQTASGFITEGDPVSYEEKSNEGKMWAINVVEQKGGAGMGGGMNTLKRKNPMSTQPQNPMYKVQRSAYQQPAARYDQQPGGTTQASYYTQQTTSSRPVFETEPMYPATTAPASQAQYQYYQQAPTTTQYDQQQY
jgi:CspA family cold shock protein